MVASSRDAQIDGFPNVEVCWYQATRHEASVTRNTHQYGLSVDAPRAHRQMHWLAHLGHHEGRQGQAFLSDGNRAPTDHETQSSAALCSVSMISSVS